jgi:glycyl-tRNA synthetase
MFEFPFGQKELWGLAYRGDYDLKQHEQFSKQSLEYTDPDDNKRKIIPHVIEPSFGVERTLLAILVSAYEEQVVKEGDTRVVLHLKPAIAPYHVAVLPLMKKDGLSEIAHEIHVNLLKNFRSDYDESGSVGKRYRRHDEIGTPFCVTVDYESKDDNCVTVRDRDTMIQERVKMDELEIYLLEKIK